MWCRRSIKEIHIGGDIEAQHKNDSACAQPNGDGQPVRENLLVPGNLGKVLHGPHGQCVVQSSGFVKQSAGGILLGR